MARAMSRSADPGDEANVMPREEGENEATTNVEEVGEKEKENKIKLKERSGGTSRKLMNRRTNEEKSIPRQQKEIPIGVDEEQNCVSLEGRRNHITKNEKRVEFVNDGNEFNMSIVETEGFSIGENKQLSVKEEKDHDVGNTEMSRYQNERGEPKRKKSGGKRSGISETADCCRRHLTNTEVEGSIDAGVDNERTKDGKGRNDRARRTQEAEKCEESVWIGGVDGKNEMINEIKVNEKRVRQKAKLERILRLGSTPLLESFIHSLPQSNHTILKAILAEVYQDLVDKRIPLLPQMQEAVETKLIQLRLFCEAKHTTEDKKEELSLSDVRYCVEMIEKTVTRMKSHNSTETSDEVDGVFFHNALSVARYLHVLKRFLRSTFTVLPWNEMEFCLIRFLSSILKPQDADEIDRLVLDKTIIVNHLVFFIDKLKDIRITDLNSKHKLPGRKVLIEKVVSQNREFKSLYNDYYILINTYSLKRIISSINIAISIDLEQDQGLGKIVIERILQVIGECLKNTPDSPNVSDDVHSLLLDSAPRQAKEITTSLRNSLSHIDSLTRKLELEKRKDSEFFGLIQNDLKKLHRETISILHRKKLDAFRGFLENIVQCISGDEINKLVARLKNCGIEEQNYFSIPSLELEKLKKVIGELELVYGGQTPEQDALFKKINDIVDFELSRIMNVEKLYADSLRTLNLRFDVRLNSTGQRKAAETILSMLENKMSTLKEIHPLIRDLIDSISYKGKKEAHIMFLKTLELYSIIEFEINRIQAIDEIKANLTTDENEENSFIKKRVMDMFSIIGGKMKSEEKKTFDEETQHKIKMHQSKTKLAIYFTKKLSSAKHEEVEEINCLELFGDLNIGGTKDDELKKNFAAKSFKSCLDLVNRVNDNYSNLIKNMKEINVFSVEKYIGALKTFFSSHKKLKPQIFKVIDEIEKINKIEIAQIYSERISQLQGILESGKSDKETDMAGEMLLLEAMEVLEHSSQLADNKLFLLEDSPVLVGKALRNYLAHGDPLVDIMPFNPRTAIFAHARALVAQGGNLIAQGLSLGHTLKLDFLEIRKRDSQREKMAAVQEQMFQAAKRGDLAAVRDWVSNGVDPLGRSINGRSPLDFAIISDDIGTFQFLIENVVNIDIRRILEKTVSNGSIKIVEHLCDGHSINLNSACLKDTNLLQRASEKGNKDVLEYLLRRGIARGLLDHCGEALVIAVNEGHTDIIEILFRFMEKSPARQELKNLMFLALFKGHSDIVRFLLHHDADCNRKLYSNWTPLFFATFFGRNDSVLDLLSNGASVNAESYDGCTPLHIALMEGREDIAMILLNHEADIHNTDSKGFSVLHLAAHSGAGQAVRFFLENGLSVNSMTMSKNTPLQLAAENGHVGTVCALLDHGADAHVREVERGRTALHLAAQNGAVDVVRAIARRHPDAVNVGDANKNSPLHLAAENGHSEVAKVLVSRGADLSSRDVEQRTPLHAAAQFGKQNVVIFLLEAGAEVDPLDLYKLTPLHESIFNKQPAVSKLLIAKGAQIKANTVKGVSMLHLASNAGCLGTVRDLIARGADVNCTDNEFGQSPLHVAAEIGRKDVVLVLLDAGASINTQDSRGRTPLFVASYKGNKDVVAVLAARCPPAVNNPTEGSLTPLWVAAFNGFGDVVATLLRHGADVNANFSGAALQTASLNGHNHVVEQLLRHGADVNASKENEDGPSSPLHSAVQKDHRKVVNTLLDFGADVNARDRGVTPLHTACEHGHEDLALLLVEWGADAHARRECGCTPLHLAAGNGLARLTRSLLTHGADVWDTSHDQSPLQKAIVGGHVDVVLALLDHEATDGDRAAAAQAVLGEAASLGQKAVVAALLEVPGVAVNVGESPSDHTALHFAAANGQADVAETLLDHHAFVNVQDMEGRTPLHCACFRGHIQVATSLLNRGADANITTQLGRAPLHMAAYNGHTDTILLLLENQVTVEPRDVRKYTPLHFAAYHCHSRSIELLAAHGASIDARDIGGATPLLLTSVGEGEPTAKAFTAEALLAAGANPNLHDCDGLSPLAIAVLNGEADLVAVLLQGGANANAPDANGKTLFQMALQEACTKNDHIREIFELIAGLLLSME